VRAKLFFWIVRAHESCTSYLVAVHVRKFSLRNDRCNAAKMNEKGNENAQGLYHHHRSPELWRYRKHAVGFCRPNLQNRV
jgi:hypothetical protein